MINKFQKKKGFTLVELLVVLAIFSLLVGVVLFKHQEFRDNIIITDLAYQIALSLKEAQVYGINVVGLNQSFDTGYGIHLSEDTSDQYVLFADKFDAGQRSGDYKYGGISSGGNCTSECVSAYTLTKGFIIEDVCGIKKSVETCYQGFTNMDIIFVRPDPSAIFSIYNNNQSSDRSAKYESVKIKLKSPQNKRRVVEVFSTGQISVRNN